MGFPSLVDLGSPTLNLLRHSNYAVLFPTFPTWMWGVVICIFATGLTALGLVLQKYSHMLNAKSQKSVVYYRQPWWLFGISIFAVAQVINLISMSLAPQVMLSCLGATALIFNAIFARMVLEEELHFFEMMIMLGMACAVVMVISTTPVPHTGVQSLDEIIGPLMTFRFIAVAASLLLGLLVLRFVIVDAAAAQKLPDLEPMTWALCSAVSSGYTVNLMKATSEFVLEWADTKPLHHWECYAILIIACLCGVSQVHCLNRALNTGRAMLVVPAYFSLGLLAQLGVAELITLDVPLDPVSGAIFGLGISLIMVFIIMLVRAKIVYEEQPDADLEEVAEKVFTSLVSTPTAAGADSEEEAKALLAAVPPTATPATPRMYSHLSRSLPAGDMDKELGMSRLRNRCNSWSGWEHEMFKDSFEGRERTYTVSIVGFGIA